MAESAEMENVIVVYSGRFQPFHKGHYSTYKHLIDKFGKDKVYIGTSNKTDNQKSPFNFQEKKTIMTKMFGIPSNKIIQVKNTYAPTEILSKYDAAKTGFITVVGEKDGQRLGGKYFTPYKGKVEDGYLDKGYVYVAPAQPNAISGTDVRNWLGRGSDDEKKVGFQKAYPKFDPTVFKFITLKLSKLGEVNEMGLGGGAGVGLSLPGGYINGAPNPKDVKKLKSKLDGDGSEEYQPIDEKVVDGKVICDNCNWEWEMKDGGDDMYLCHKCGHDNEPKSPNQQKENTIVEYTGNGAFYNDGNTTSGTMWNANWDDYDSEGYYLDNLEGWVFFYEKPSEVEKKKAVDQKLPTHDQNDGKTHKYHRILKYNFPKPTDNLAEGIELDVKLGDTILMGKFKNHKVVVKSISKDEYGMPTINGKKVATFRIPKNNEVDEMAKADMDKVEKYADAQLSPEDVVLGKETDHFFQRLNDPRNGKEISPAELTGFFKRLGRNKKKLLDFVKQYKEFVVKDKRTNINIPFMVSANKLIAKTVMRKDDFKSSTPVLTTESKLIKENINESKLLMEGGAYGHMHHPFDIEMNLTFSDLKNIVKKALTGDLDVAREKTDGQALAISWVNGRLVAARNKSHLKNKGEGAMTMGQVADKFANRGGLTDAYNFAMKDLSSAISQLSDKQREKIFNGGSSFMNLEVIYPTSVNVIPYNQPLLVFHGTFDYDINGNIVGENQTSARILAGMIKQVNGHVQSKYTIQGPPMQRLPKTENLSKLQGKYFSMIGKLQSEFGLADSDGVADYHQKWWEKFVAKEAKGMDTQQQIGLVKRWAFGDKSFRLGDIKDEKLKAWADKIDKQDQAKIAKENLMKFEEIFLGVGADVLGFMESVLTANPTEATKQMVARLNKTIQDVKKLGDPKKLDKLKLELQRLQALGGFEKIVPNEGIVFVYNGNTYKLTGAFAPLNQILGLFYE